MNLQFDLSLGEKFSSNSQRTRILTEHWVKENSYCPNCGKSPLNAFENNRPVSDFYCTTCSEEFELKSKSGLLSKTITDGAYSKMIERINANNNPNFFFLTYSATWTVRDFLIIPKQFFNDSIIIKRNPLAATAKRAGWIGCNIDLSKVAESGKIFIVKNSHVIDKKIVKESFSKTIFLRNQSKESKSWLLDIMRCIDSIKSNVFTLKDVYIFEPKLKKLHPENNFVKEKIRQQLQVLRDKGIIEFVSNGNYKKIPNGTIQN